MSSTAILILFVATLLVAARLCLRGERRPPIPPDSEVTTDPRDRARPSGEGNRRRD